MTLTPAIKEALERYDELVLKGGEPAGTPAECDQWKADYDAAQLALLSVVAAEEGRKYEELVKLHREWVEAKAVRTILSYATTPYGELSEAVERLQRAESALAQWEAK